MLNFPKILFPVDFSERSKQTAPYVAWIARKFQSRVALLHVLDISFAAPAGPLLRPEPPKSYAGMIRKNRESDLAEFAAGIFDGLCVTRVVELGDAAEIITRHAEHNEMDLIVLPTHGLGRFRWLLLGSVTAKVLHDSLCPVWTSVHSDTLPPATAKKIRTIVCGVDLYSESVRVINAASDMAANYGSVVRLVHAIAAPEGKPGSNIDAGLKRFLFDTAREQIAKYQDDAGTDWELCIQSGSIASVLSGAALHFEADLVVIGRGHLHDRFGRLRTNVGAIIRESPCPVLSV
jgi:nucleotide-binding universal stress UspA family protein